MTKREREALARKLAKLETRIGKKRDELRGLVENFRCIIESVDEADEQIETALSEMRCSRRSLEDATDSLSQYV